MAKNPEDRYATCGELVTEAEAALGLERRSGHRRLLIAAAVLALLAALALAIATRAGGEAVSTEVVRNTLVRVDPKTNSVAAVVDVGEFPGATAVGGNRVWAYNFNDSTVSEIDADANEVRHTTHVVTTPYLAAGEGSVIAADAEGAWVAGYIATTGGSVLTRIFRGGETRQYRLRANVVEVVTGAGALWVLGRRADVTELIRVDARNGSVARRVRLSGLSGSVGGLSFGGGRLWLIDKEAGVLYRIDPASGRTSSTDLGGYVLRPTYGIGFVWLCALTTHGPEMMRVDPRTLQAEFAGKGLPAEEGGEYVAGLGSVWRLDLLSGTLMRFDPKTRDLSGLVRVLDPRRGGISVTSIAAGDDALWLAVA